MYIPKVIAHLQIHHPSPLKSRLLASLPKTGESTIEEKKKTKTNQSQRYPAQTPVFGPNSNFNPNLRSSFALASSSRLSNSFLQSPNTTFNLQQPQQTRPRSSLASHPQHGFAALRPNNSYQPRPVSRVDSRHLASRAPASSLPPRMMAPPGLSHAHPVQTRNQSRFAASMASHVSTLNPQNLKTPQVQVQAPAQDAGTGLSHAHPVRAPPGFAPSRPQTEAVANPWIELRPPPQPAGKAYPNIGYLQDQAQKQFRNEENFAASLSRAAAPTYTTNLRSQTPAVPPGFEGHDFSRLSQPTPPLPASLNAALAAATQTRKLPSVLEPKTAAAEIEYTAAIEYLTSLLSTASSSVNFGGEQSLRDRPVDVTFYDPAGTYLIPVRELVLRNTTSLSALVLELQGLLDQNIRDLNRMSHRNVSRYLVHSVQVRIFNVQAFEAFPKVQGDLGSSDGVHGAEYVQWARDSGEMELYWNTYRRVVQLGIGGDGMPAIAKPMFKVRTILKLDSSFDAWLIGGGHAFANVKPVAEPEPNPQPPAEPAPQTARVMQRNRFDLNEEDQALLAGVMGVLSQNGNSEDVSKADILAAVTNVYATRQAAKMEDKISAEYCAKMKNSFSYKKYETQFAELRKQNGLPPIEKPVDPTRNWGYYQRMSGNPEIHKAFDLSKSKAPFEEEDIPPPGFYDHLHVGNRPLTEADMVPYMEIDPIVYKLENNSDLKPHVVKRQLEQKEAAISFDEEDDEVFFPEAIRDRTPNDGPVTIANRSPTNLPKRHSRIDVHGLLSSVHIRKNSAGQLQNLAGINRTMSPNPLQHFTGNQTDAFSLDMSHGSFASFNNFASAAHTSGPGFYDNAYSFDGTQTQATAYESFLNASSNTTANLYDSLGDSGVISNSYSLAKNSQADPFSLNVQSKPAVASLSAYKQILSAKNPNLGKVTSVGVSSSQYNNSSKAANASNNQAAVTFNTVGTPSSPVSLSSYLSTVKQARGARTPFPRPRVASNLRADSPAFKSAVQPQATLTPSKLSIAGAGAGIGNSPSAYLGSGLTTGLQKLSIEESEVKPSPTKNDA